MQCKFCNKDECALICINNEIFCCEDCYNEHFVKCAECGQILNKNSEDCVKYKGEHYCKQCYNELFTNCSFCGDVFDLEDAYYTHCGDIICPNCFENDYFICDDCGDIYHHDDGVFLDDATYCEFCYNEYYINEYGIHAHEYKPCLNFYGDDDRENNLHVGIELEIQGSKRNDFCNSFNDKFGGEDTFYMKQDGSLISSAGVEIVSHPMTYEYIIETDDWKTLFDKLNKYEMNNINSCGLHFHLDRKYFAKKDISVIDYIVNNFSDYFTKIGGRPLNDYCQKSYKRYDQWGENIVSRYHTVNLENSETIELRFCQSTYLFGVFLERLKMIFAIADFAKSHTLSECYDLDTMQIFEKEFEKYYSKYFNN